jgi:hypothetical protein
MKGIGRRAAICMLAPAAAAIAWRQLHGKPLVLVFRMLEVFVGKIGLGVEGEQGVHHAVQPHRQLRDGPRSLEREHPRFFICN